jgi:hypothetical protein
MGCDTRPGAECRWTVCGAALQPLAGLGRPGCSEILASTSMIGGTSCGPQTSAWTSAGWCRRHAKR